jgi:hypothetical protein
MEDDHPEALEQRRKISLSFDTQELAAIVGHERMAEIEIPKVLS